MKFILPYDIINLQCFKYFQHISILGNIIVRIPLYAPWIKSPTIVPVFLFQVGRHKTANPFRLCVTDMSSGERSVRDPR